MGLEILPPKINQRLVNAYVLSAYDYCIDIWAVKSKLEFFPLQNKINRYLYSSVYKSLLEKCIESYVIVPEIV